MATKKNEIQKAEPITALSTAPDAAEWEQYAGEGFENQTVDDYSIPYLSVLQSLSGAVKADESLRPGMIINTVTGEAYKGKEGVAFVPAFTEHVFVEWVPRSAGGGFVGRHEVGSDLVRAAVAASTEFGKYKTDEGNDLVETYYVYGVALGADGPYQAVIAFKKTAIKKYKGWQTKAKTVQIELPDGRRIGAPLFAHRYRLTSVEETKNSDSWHSWNIAWDGEDAAASRLSPRDPVLLMAKALKDAVQAGTAKADYASENAAAAEDDSTDGKPVF